MRYRIEIYDDIKDNDITLYYPTPVDKDLLSELVYLNLYKFKGNVRAFVYDKHRKKKTTYLILPYEMVTKINSYRPK